MAEILRSSAKVSLAVLASRILGVVRESMFARVFTVGWLSDSYMVAFRIPNLLRDLFAEGALSSAFVPTFSDALMNEGKDRAYRLGNLVLTGILLVTGLLTLLGLLFAPQLVGLITAADPKTLSAEAAALRLQSRPLTAALAQVMMPILTLVSISAVWMGMLNAQRRFTVPAYAPALFNVTSILSAIGVMVIGFESYTAIFVWSGATTVAAAVQAFCQVPALWRLGYRPGLAFRGLTRDPGVRRIVRLMGPAVLGLAAVQVNVLVNTYFADKLEPGSQTYLNFAFRLFYLPIGLFGVALGTITTTRVSEEAARGDRAALVARTAEGVRAVWLLASASAVGLVVLAGPVIQLLFQGGEFQRHNTEVLRPVVQAYMAGVLPYSLVKVFAPSFYTLDRPRIPMMASLCGVAANLVFNALTYQRLGTPGLAFGTTIAALVNLIILRIAFTRAVGATGGRVGRDLLALAVGNAVLGATAYLLWWGAAAVLPAAQAALFFLPWRILHGLALFATIGLAFLLYAETTRRLGYPGADELLRLPRRLLAKVRGRK